MALLLLLESGTVVGTSLVKAFMLASLCNVHASWGLQSVGPEAVCSRLPPFRETRLCP